MATTSLDLMQDAEVDHFGEEVQLVCDCGETWMAIAYGGEDVSLEQLACPAEGCDGEGSEA